MKHKLKYYNLLSCVAMCFALPAAAQQITGTPVHPDATVVIDGKQIHATMRRRRDQGSGFGFQTVVAAARHRAAKGPA